ncbi:MAG: transposase [Ignavibacteria bacterium]
MRKAYSLEVRRKALKMLLDENTTSQQVADELGIDSALVRQWKSRYLYNDKLDIDYTENEALEKENMILKKKNTELLQEIEVLKNALAIFSKPSK